MTDIEDIQPWTESNADVWLRDLQSRAAQQVAQERAAKVAVIRKSQAERAKQQIGLYGEGYVTGFREGWEAALKGVSEFIEGARR